MMASRKKVRPVTGVLNSHSGSLISGLRRKSIKIPSIFSETQVCIGAFADEWQKWQIRAGLSPNSHLPVSQSGIYTDFN